MATQIVRDEGLRYSDLRRIILESWIESNDHVFLVEGEPGVGKSYLGRDLYRAMGVLPEHYVEINISNRSETDLIGLPNNSGDFSRFVPPEDFYRLRDDPNDHRPRFLMVEEASDSGPQLQNPLCRIVYDKMCGSMPLHHNLYIYMNANRVEHKSGANRLITKLAGRVNRRSMKFDFVDFSRWWLETGLNPMIIGALKYKEEYACQFDPLRDQNPMPRTWAKAAKIPMSLPDDLYLAALTGYVGEGAALHVATFKDVYGRIVDPEKIAAEPTKYAPPTDAAAQYASMHSLTSYAKNESVFESVLTGYISKFPVEVQAAFFQFCLLVNRRVRNTRAGIKYLAANAHLVFEG